MSKAIVVRAQPVEPPVEKVVLELSEEEARALQWRMYNHAHQPHHGQHQNSRYLNRIYDALTQAMGQHPECP